MGITAVGACRRPTVIDALGVFGDLSPGGRPDRSHIALRWSRSWHPPCYDTAMVRGLVLVSSRPAKAARPSQKRARTRCTGTLAKASATQASSVEGAHARVVSYTSGRQHEVRVRCSVNNQAQSGKTLPGPFAALVLFCNDGLLLAKQFLKTLAGVYHALG